MSWISRFAIAVLDLACATFAAHAAEVALSFVHKEDRIDVPTNAVLRIKAYATITIVDPATRRRTELPSPSVELCLSKEVRDQIHRLTSRIIDQPLDIVVGCEVVASPVVREPMGTLPCFQITASDAADAAALADKLRSGSRRCRAPTS
jgi:preprotein translocase subunit SecD